MQQREQPETRGVEQLNLATPAQEEEVKQPAEPEEAVNAIITLNVKVVPYSASKGHRYRHLKTSLLGNEKNLSKYGLSDEESKTVSIILEFDVVVSDPSSKPSLYPVYIGAPPSLTSLKDLEELCSTYEPDLPCEIYYLSVVVEGCPKNLAAWELIRMDPPKTGSSGGSTIKPVLKSLKVKDTGEVSVFNLFPFSSDPTAFGGLTTLNLHFTSPPGLAHGGIFFPLNYDESQRNFGSVRHVSLSADEGVKIETDHLKAMYRVFQNIQTLKLNQPWFEAFQKMPSWTRKIPRLELDQCHFFSLDQAAFQGVSETVKLFKPRSTIELQVWADTYFLARSSTMNESELFHFLQGKWSDLHSPSMELEKLY